MWGSRSMHQCRGDIFSYIGGRTWDCRLDVHFERALKLRSAACHVALLEDVGGDVCPLVMRRHGKGSVYAMLKRKGNWMWTLDEGGVAHFLGHAGREFQHFFDGSIEACRATVPLFMQHHARWISSHDDFALLATGSGPLFDINGARMRRGLRVLHVPSNTCLQVDSGAAEDFRYTISGSAIEHVDSRLFWPEPRDGLPKWFPFLVLKSLRRCSHLV